MSVRTNLPPDPTETDKTVKTDLIGNNEFLLAVFGETPVDARPLIVSFEGSPVSVTGKSWYGSPWAMDDEVSTTLPANTNNYFSLAAFRPDEAGRYRRQKKHFNHCAR